MERLVLNHLCSYLSYNKSLLKKHQSGFRSLHSTAVALLDATNQWYFNIENGLVTSVVFLDLAKALTQLIIISYWKNYGSLVLVTILFHGLKHTLLVDSRGAKSMVFYPKVNQFIVKYPRINTGAFAISYLH